MDDYFAFVNTVQAMRRRAEALSTALGGALGVAAEPLPHQLASVRRILSETRIRHLLADEVGLGKTVQALMVMNALRWQRPEHRTVIVAPERLLAQWNDECWTRAHVMTSLDPTEADEAAVKLIRPSDLTLRRDDGGRTAVLNPDKWDMLIVDEPQTMPIEVVQYIARMSEGFQQVLVLSATPQLGEAKWREPIMRMLEPELSEVSRRRGIPILEALKHREEEACAHEDDPGYPLFQTAAANRRIVRSGRADWARYLPQRSNQEIFVPAVQAERMRFEVAAALTERNEPEGAEKPSWANVKLLQRSARSSRQLLRDLAQQNGALATLAKKAAEISLEDPADSRLEALLGLLSAEWGKDESQAFVVVCGDTPTMDVLEAAIPRYFPEQKGNISRLGTVAKTEAVSEITLRKTREDLAPLLSGDGKILLVGEWVQAGLNLQHFARNIIFYTVPWNVVSIDQLIGRVDRLRPETIRENGTKLRNIRIWRFEVDGSQEQSVVKALASTGVFDRPLPPMSEKQLEELSQIQAEAARGSLTAPCDYKGEFEQKAVLPTILSHRDPWTVDIAEQLWNSWKSREVLQPAMLWPSAAHSNPLEISEDALGHWLKQIEKSHDFQVGSRQELSDRATRFKTLWYAEGGDRRARPTFLLPDMGTERFRDDHKPFLFQRNHLASPAIRTVTADEGEASERPLHFLDHGNSLHDAIVDGYLKGGFQRFDREQPIQVIVRAPGNHSIHGPQGKILLSAILIDPLPDTEVPETWSQKAKDIRSRATTDRQIESLDRDQKRLREGYLAFQRWLRFQIPAQLLVSGSYLDGEKWKTLTKQQVETCLKPLSYSSTKGGRPKWTPMWARGQEQKFNRLSLDVISKERHQQEAKLKETSRNYLSQRVESLQREGTSFLQTAYIEMGRLVSSRQEALEVRLEEQVSADRKSLYEGQIAVAEREVEMAKLVQREMASFTQAVLSCSNIASGSPVVSLIMSTVEDE